MWRSWLAHLHGVQGVESSSLFTPTIFKRRGFPIGNPLLFLCYDRLTRLERFFEGPEAVGVGAFDEDGGAVDRVGLQPGLEGVCVGEQQHVVGVGKGCPFGTHQQHFVKLAVGQQAYHALVFFAFVVTELVHATDDGHGAVHGLERGDGGFHGGGIGVVAVEVEAVAAGGFLEFGALVGGSVFLDGLLDVPGFDAEVESDGYGSHAVVEVVVAEEVRADVVDVVADFEVEVEVGVAADEGAVDVGFGRGAVGEHAEGCALDGRGDKGGVVGSVGGDEGAQTGDGGEALGFVHQAFVVGVDEDESVLACEVPVEFRLGVYHAFEAAEAFEVCASDVGDEATVGVGDAAEELDFARVVGTHLDDGEFGVGGDGEQCERHAEVVVEVAFGGRGAVAFGEDGMDELLGGGFAVGAGDADDRHLEVATVFACQFLECFQHVGDHDAAVVDFVLRVADDAECGALLEGFGCEGVAVEMFALEGEEEASLGDGARVGGDGARTEECLV